MFSCEEENGIGKLIVENKEWFDCLFESIIPWDESFVVKERIV